MTRIPQTRTLVLVAALVLCGVAQAGQPVVHGIISQGYLNSTNYNYLIPSEAGSFAYNEVLLNVSASVTDNIRVGAQFMGRNFGRAGNEDVVIDWAYGDWRFRDYLGLRVGKVKTPLGFYNQTRDVDMVRTSILLPQSVYTERFRDITNGFEGLSAYGSVSLGETASLEYDVFLGTVDLDRPQYGEDIMNRYALNTVYGSTMPIASTQTELKELHGAALRFNTPLSGLRVGGSFVRNQFSTDTEWFGPLGPFKTNLKLTVKDWYVLSAEYTTEKLVIAGEFSRIFVNFDMDGILVPTGLPDPYPPVTTIGTSIQDFRGGWYGTASWQFNDWFQLGAYYSVYYPDFTERDGDYTTYQKDTALTARFDLTDFWLVKAEMHVIDGIGDVSTTENAGNTYEAEDWSMFAVKSTFYF